MKSADKFQESIDNIKQAKFKELEAKYRKDIFDKIENALNKASRSDSDYIKLNIELTEDEYETFKYGVEDAGYYLTINKHTKGTNQYTITVSLSEIKNNVVSSSDEFQESIKSVKLDKFSQLKDNYPNLFNNINTKIDQAAQKGQDSITLDITLTDEEFATFKYGIENSGYKLRINQKNANKSKNVTISTEEVKISSESSEKFQELIKEEKKARFEAIKDAHPEIFNNIERSFKSAAKSLQDYITVTITIDESEFQIFQNGMEDAGYKIRVNSHSIGTSKYNISLSLSELKKEEYHDSLSLEKIRGFNINRLPFFETHNEEQWYLNGCVDGSNIVLGLVTQCYYGIMNYLDGNVKYEFISKIGQQQYEDMCNAIQKIMTI